MAKNKEEKEAPSLDAILKEINKKFGVGTILTKDTIADVKFIPTGSIALDETLGGGWACGRMHELIGMESSSKTTLALTAAANVQKQGRKVAYIDMEHALDSRYMTALGVNLDELILTQPASAEEALDIVEMLTRSGEVALIVVDSVAALTPNKELEGGMGDSVMGIHARLMSQAMRKLVAISHETDTTILWINQIRHKIGVMYGNPETCVSPDTLVEIVVD